MALNRNNRQKARSAFFGNNSGLETSKYSVKKALIPGYGKKGMGWLHPKRKLYNTIYKKTTFSLFDLFK